jgi:tetratricopeptide (TPR) repeat protein
MKVHPWWIVILSLSCGKSIGAEQPSASASRAAPPAPGITSIQPASDGAQAYQQSYDLEAQGKNDAALGALDGLPPSLKQSYVASFRRGWLLYRLGRHEEAVASYAKATAAQPSSIEAKVGRLAPLIALRRWNDLEAGAREVLREDPRNYTANIRLAFALYNQGRYGEAEAAYRGLSAAYPSEGDVRGGLGWSLLKLGRTADAAAVFSEVLVFSPRNALALDGVRALASGTKP